MECGQNERRACSSIFTRRPSCFQIAGCKEDGRFCGVGSSLDQRCCWHTTWTTMSRVNSPHSFQMTELTSMINRPRETPFNVGDATARRPRAVPASTPHRSSGQHRITLRDVLISLVVIATLSTRIVVAEVASHPGAMTTSTSTRVRHSSSVRNRSRHHMAKPHTTTIASVIGDSDLEEFDYDMGSCRPDNCTTREVFVSYMEAA